MIKKIMLASCVLVASMTSQAALISYNGYERDTAKNYVTGGGLEWLKWDVTKGMSINSALSAYESQGWRLASNDDMAILFNQFKFGKSDWHALENVVQSHSTPWGSGDELSSHVAFISLFGVINTVDSYWYCRESRRVDCTPPHDAYTMVAALYGHDSNKNGLFNFASIFDDYSWIDENGTLFLENGHALKFADHYHSSFYTLNSGVALVRDITPDPVAVPTPGPIGLLALGLLALGYRRRQVLGR